MAASPFELRKLTKPLFKASIPSGPQKYREQLETIPYYNAAALEENDRLILAGTLSHAADGLLPVAETFTWFLTLTECFFPGLVSKVFTDLTTVVLTPVNLSQPDLSFLQGKTLPTTLALIPTATYDGEYLNESTDVSLYGLYLTVVFAIGKTPSESNLIAFTVNRPRAYLGRQSLTEVPYVLEQSRMPLLGTYQSIHGAFNSYLEMRRAFVLELIRWTASSVTTPRISAAVPMVRLWESSGMTHIMLIKNLIEAYSDVLQRVKPLYPEVHRFIHEYDLSTSSHGFGMSYYKLLEGDRRSILFSREYPELLKLAREIASRQEPRFKQYAGALGGSAYLEVFEQLARDMNIPLPGDGAQSDDELVA